MKLTLPSGRECQIGVFHKEFGDSMDEIWQGSRRGTEIRFTLEGQEIKVRSICRPPDPFVKRNGRKMAANKLLGELRARDIAVEAERAAIFLAICPEFDPNRKLAKKVIDLTHKEYRVYTDIGAMMIFANSFAEAEDKARKDGHTVMSEEVFLNKLKGE